MAGTVEPPKFAQDFPKQGRRQIGRRRGGRRFRYRRFVAALALGRLR
jgi:hypothetical protein